MPPTRKSQSVKRLSSARSTTPLLSELADLRNATEGTDTREALKAAAMRLFAERGVEAVSVRDIILDSGAKNGGSLNYYFGSKEALISEIVRDIFEASSDAWLEGLSGVLKQGGPKSIRDIVRIIVYAPPVMLKGEKSPTAARVLASLLFTRRHFVAEQMRQMNLSVFNRLLAHMRELRPDIPDNIMQQRLIFVAWYMSAILSAREAATSQTRRGPDLWSAANSLGNLVDTATALIEAPMEDVLAAVQASQKASTANVPGLKITAKRARRRKA